MNGPRPIYSAKSSAASAMDKNSTAMRQSCDTNTQSISTYDHPGSAAKPSNLKDLKDTSRFTMNNQQNDIDIYSEPTIDPIYDSKFLSFLIFVKNIL